MAAATLAIDSSSIATVIFDCSFNVVTFSLFSLGALFALMLPFVKYGPEVSFQMPIDSIAVSFHKFLGAPQPSGLIITRRTHVERLSRSIEYLNSKVGFCLVGFPCSSTQTHCPPQDTTIMGSRNGQSALLAWYALRKRGARGMLDDVQKCFENARYAGLVSF
jgi:histidine decarboxylase